MPLSAEAIESAARTLVGRLKNSRERLAGHPVGDVRDELEREMRSALAGLSPADSQQALDSARELLLAEAQEEMPRADPRASEHVRALEAQLAAAEAERLRLADENARLRTQAAAPAHAAAPVVAGDLRFQAVRKAVQLLAQNPDTHVESLHLSPEETAFVLAVHELLRFAVDYKSAMNMLMQDFRIGPAAKMNSMMFDAAIREMQDRFLACLTNQRGALEAMKSSLSRNRELLVQLNEAYTSCIPRGARKLLQEIDPEPISTKNKGVLGTDAKAAWESFVRAHGDLSNLNSAELWERFFQPHLREHLSGSYPAPAHSQSGEFPRPKPKTRR